MNKTTKPNPDDLKETFGLFLKQSDVNYTFTNLVLSDKEKAMALSKTISEECDVTCIVVDESFSFVRDEKCNA